MSAAASRKQIPETSGFLGDTGEVEVRIAEIDPDWSNVSAGPLLREV